jgi:hypothetical protein
VIVDEGNFGAVRQDARGSYSRGATATVVFVSANPRNNLLTANTFLTVERLGPNGQFVFGMFISVPKLGMLTFSICAGGTLFTTTVTGVRNTSGHVRELLVLWQQSLGTSMLWKLRAVTESVILETTRPLPARFTPFLAQAELSLCCRCTRGCYTQICIYTTLQLTCQMCQRCFKVRVVCGRVKNAFYRFTEGCHVVYG